MTRPIWLISGAPGAGKTSVSQTLCRRYPQGVHLPVDVITEFILTGRERGPAGPRSRPYFPLVRANVARMAAAFADAGYGVVIDDTLIDVDDRIAWYTRELGDRPLRKVLLAPSLEVAASRNATRTTKSAEDNLMLAPVTRELHPLLLAENTPAKGWVVIDSSTLSIEETTDAILARQ